MQYLTLERCMRVTSCKMLSQLTLSVFTLLLLRVYRVSSQHDCNFVEITQCMQQIQVANDKPGLVFASTEDSIDEKCGLYNGAMQCVDNFLNKCVKQSIPDGFRSTIGGLKNFLAGMCTQGSEFRKEYLTYVDCYQKVEPGYKACADTFATQSVEVMKRNLSKENRIKEGCGIFHELRECTRTAILSKCGSKAADFGANISRILGGDVINTKCFSAGISLHSIRLTYVWFCLVFVFIKNGLFCKALQ